MTQKNSNNKNYGNLFLIPVDLGNPSGSLINPQVKRTIGNIRQFIVENEKSARRFIIVAGMKAKLDDIIMYPLNKKISPNEWIGYLDSIYDGQDMGLMSEAGCPGIADPGAEIVSLAQSNNIRVIPMIGPSSVMMALMASGLNGQNFAFNGYLPVDRGERIRKVKDLENLSGRTNQTQIFMETPYRNMALLEDVISNCKENTSLCIASNITMPDESIVTRPVKAWENNLPDINKKPTIFLINANSRT